MSSDREPLWLVPANQVKPRERLRSIGFGFFLFMKFIDLNSFEEKKFEKI